MVSDIARTFFTQLSSGGCVLNSEILRTLKHTYMANARSYVKTYEDFSKMTGLHHFDMHQELGAIEIFAGVLEQAFHEFQHHPFGSPLIPEWRRIEVALDGILSELAAAFADPNS